MGCLINFGLLVLGCVQRTAENSIIWNYADPLTLLELINYCSIVVQNIFLSFSLSLCHSFSFCLFSFLIHTHTSSLSLPLAHLHKHKNLASSPPISLSTNISLPLVLGRHWSRFLSAECVEVNTNFLYCTSLRLLLGLLRQMKPNIRLDTGYKKTGYPVQP